MSSSPSLKLHFLQASRCIRTAWQLEALGLAYTVKFSARENGVAPPQFRREAGGLGKFPTLEDGGEVWHESGAICEYLEDTYDRSNTLLAPPGTPKRYKTLQWVHAAEGAFMIPGLAVLYSRWFQPGEAAAATEAGLSKNVGNALDFLESELGKSGGRFLMGEELSVADIMCHFSASFIFARELGTMGRRWPAVEKWIAECEATESFRRAVEHTGYKL